jgi:hypothetical protein
MVTSLWSEQDKTGKGKHYYTTVLYYCTVVCTVLYYAMLYSARGETTYRVSDVAWKWSQRGEGGGG